jgi:hypothetical protein
LWPAFLKGRIKFLKTHLEKSFDLLVVLVENSGHLVVKGELMKRIWPDSFVEEANLSVKMSALRRALGEGPNDRQYVETVPPHHRQRQDRAQANFSAAGLLFWSGCSCFPSLFWG